MAKKNKKKKEKGGERARGTSQHTEKIKKEAQRKSQRKKELHRLQETMKKAEKPADILNKFRSYRKKLKNKGMSEKEIRKKLREEIGEKGLKKYERIKKKYPKLTEKSPGEITEERYRELFKDADRVVVPKKAKETAEKGSQKEQLGTLRAHKVEKEGEKIIVLLPRYKGEYGEYDPEKQGITPSEKIKKERLFKESENDLKELKKRKKLLEEDEVGMAHTHPTGSLTPGEELSPGDLKVTSEEKVPLLVIPEGLKNDSEPIKGEIAYPSKEDTTSRSLWEGKTEGVDTKEVDYAKTEEIGKLLKGIPEKRAKEKGLPMLLKKKSKKEEQKH